ncbi:MAG: hypothetical protein Terrestrivirus10_29 [Terrestrivirus sp.]|uniref:Uncharacterized protein n=1 Tax=Terrestrivirus sp. TaxID=2487775 RepID=A0A3G4ZP34_9VIRU|nr:MAG: hypothetical protein Terrestrivirus10_29 [Terrestrivirus sp.]
MEQSESNKLNKSSESINILNDVDEDSPIEKLCLLRKLNILKDQGFMLPQNFTMTSDINQMKLTYDFFVKTIEKRNEINKMKSDILSVFYNLKILQQKYDISEMLDEVREEFKKPEYEWCRNPNTNHNLDNYLNNNLDKSDETQVKLSHNNSNDDIDLLIEI